MVTFAGLHCDVHREREDLLVVVSDILTIYEVITWMMVSARASRNTL